MHLFFFWMLLASGLGFLKILALARLLAPADFGDYVSILGVAMLSAVLLSCGLLEGTTKLYPRLWITGERPRILTDARSVAGKLLLRFLAVAVLLIVAASLFDLRYPPAVFAIAAVVGLGTGLLTLVASVLRASDSPDVLRQFTFMRSALTLIIVGAGALLFGWKGALAGEALAAFSAFIVAYFSIRTAFAAETPFPAEPSGVAPMEATGGGRLYWATLFSSSTGLADRGFVNLALGAAAAGAYGVLALLFQIGQLLSNILAQRVGPLVIKAGYAGNQSHGVPGSLKMQAGVLTGLAIVLISAVLTLKALDFPAGLFTKYSLSNVSIVLAGLIGMLQIYGLLEFHLLAHDRENAVLAASSIASLSFFLFFGTCWALGLSLDWFVFSMFLARLIHVSLLVIMIKRNG